MLKVLAQPTPNTFSAFRFYQVYFAPINPYLKALALQYFPIKTTE